MNRSRPHLSDPIVTRHEIPRVEWRWADETRWRPEPIDQFVDRFDGSLTERDVVAAIKKHPSGASYPTGGLRGLRVAVYVRAANQVERQTR